MASGNGVQKPKPKTKAKQANNEENNKSAFTKTGNYSQASNMNNAAEILAQRAQNVILKYVKTKFSAGKNLSALNTTNLKNHLLLLIKARINESQQNTVKASSSNPKIIIINTVEQLCVYLMIKFGDLHHDLKGTRGKKAEHMVGQLKPTTILDYILDIQPSDAMPTFKKYVTDVKWLGPAAKQKVLDYINALKPDSTLLTKFIQFHDNEGELANELLDSIGKKGIFEKIPNLDTSKKYRLINNTKIKGYLIDMIANSSATIFMGKLQNINPAITYESLIDKGAGQGAASPAGLTYCFCRYIDYVLTADSKNEEIKSILREIGKIIDIKSLVREFDKSVQEDNNDTRAAPSADINSTAKARKAEQSETKTDNLSDYIINPNFNHYIIKLAGGDVVEEFKIVRSKDTGNIEQWIRIFGPANPNANNNTTYNSKPNRKGVVSKLRRYNVKNKKHKFVQESNGNWWSVSNGMSADDIKFSGKGNISICEHKTIGDLFIILAAIFEQYIHITGDRSAGGIAKFFAFCTDKPIYTIFELVNNEISVSPALRNQLRITRVNMRQENIQLINSLNRNQITSLFGSTLGVQYIFDKPGMLNQIKKIWKKINISDLETITKKLPAAGKIGEPAFKDIREIIKKYVTISRINMVRSTNSGKISALNRNINAALEKIDSDIKRYERSIASKRSTKNNISTYTIQLDELKKQKTNLEKFRTRNNEGAVTSPLVRPGRTPAAGRAISSAQRENKSPSPRRVPRNRSPPAPYRPIRNRSPVSSGNFGSVGSQFSTGSVTGTRKNNSGMEVNSKVN